MAGEETVVVVASAAAAAATAAATMGGVETTAETATATVTVETMVIATGTAAGGTRATGPPGTGAAAATETGTVIWAGAVMAATGVEGSAETLDGELFCHAWGLGCLLIVVCCRSAIDRVRCVPRGNGVVIAVPRGVALEFSQGSYSMHCKSPLA